MKKLLIIISVGLLLQPQASFSSDYSLSQSFKAIGQTGIKFRPEANKGLALRLLGATAPHVCLAYTQSPSLTLQDRIAQHALLWASTNVIGLVGTIGHEMGHAIMESQPPQNSVKIVKAPKITVYYSPANVLTGIYSGVTKTTTEQSLPKLTNENQDKDGDFITSKEAFLAWAVNKQAPWSHEIKSLLAGPIAGIITKCTLVGMLSYLQPAWSHTKIGGVGFFALLATIMASQDLLNAVPFNVGYDGNKAWKLWQQSKEIRDIATEVRTLPDGTQFTIDFAKTN